MQQRPCVCRRMQMMDMRAPTHGSLTHVHLVHGMRVSQGVSSALCHTAWPVAALLDRCSAPKHEGRPPCCCSARPREVRPHLKMGMTQEKSGMPTFSLPKQPALSEMPMAVIASRALSPRAAL